MVGVSPFLHGAENCGGPCIDNMCFRYVKGGCRTRLNESRQWLAQGVLALNATKRCSALRLAQSRVAAVRGAAVIGHLRPAWHRATDRFPITWTCGFDPQETVRNRHPMSVVQRWPTVRMKSQARNLSRISVIQDLAITGVECQLVKVLQTLQPSGWRGRGASMRLPRVFCLPRAHPESISVNLRPGGNRAGRTNKGPTFQSPATLLSDKNVASTTGMGTMPSSTKALGSLAQFIGALSLASTSASLRSSTSAV